MTQDIEDQKEVSVQEASLPTAAVSESHVITINTNCTHEQYDDYKKLKLIEAVNMGL